MVTGYLQARTAHFRILNWQYWTLIIFKLLVTAAMLIVGALLLVDQQISVGQFIAAEIIILLLVGSVEKLIISLDNVYDVLTAAEKVSKVVDKPQQEDGNLSLPVRTTGMAIRLQNVSLSYSSGHPVLQQVSLAAEANDKICIQGPTSAGKSTLLRLLSGSFAHFEGIFTADGQTLRTLNLNSYREQTGILLPQHGLYEGSLWENIAVGRPDVDRQYAMHLSEVCGLSAFVESHPLGFDMPVNTLGKQLPQRVIKQILWIRALAHKPRLLLLDEPCQGLDAADAQSIQTFLAGSLSNTTLIVVSDKPEYTRFCNKVFSMENGILTPIH
jgi:ABC-type bacteriocin/lantibiotic exporter with double-glycine peptidase domain